MINPEDRQEIARLSLLMARKKLEINEIANRLGCSRQTLGPFLKGAPLGEELLDRAEALARETGYWLPDMYPSNPAMRWEYAASDLASLAEFLGRADATDDDKAKRMALVIDFYAGLLETAKSNLESKGQGLPADL